MLNGVIHQGHVLDVLKTIPDESVQCVVTSPPYWGLRDYKIEPQVWDAVEGCEHEWGGNTTPARNETKHSEAVHKEGFKDAFRNSKEWVDHKVDASPSGGQFCLRCGAWCGSLGLEPTPELFCQHIVQVFREVLRVLRKDGTLWLNLGDSYVSNASSQIPQTKDHKGSGYAGPNRNGMTGLKPKNLCGIPWRVAFALQQDGWWLRSDIIWHKPNPMPESVTDRPTKAHEYLFLLTKSQNYFFDQEAVKEPSAWPNGPNSPSSIASPYGQGFTRRASWKGSSFEDGRNLLNHPNVGKNRKPLRSDIESRHRASIPGGQSMQANPGETRNLRSVWTIATQPFPEAHFATFPEAIPERCIKAGTSEKGCCPDCGKPWVRVVESPEGREYVYKTIGIPGEGDNRGRRPGAMGTSHAVSTGWQSSCACGKEPVTGVVLDPFFGAGTVGLVAEKLNRKWIGIELNPEYVEMARKRILGKCWNVEEDQENWLQDVFHWPGD